ncbi:uncharacterized protein LOC125750962 [Brienomyrus brachyistius]|uniref:uncharacterized protein LOC125750962 n=1 Tax=Brienomyrus brachyistius TaxID=42636 RepID=UPI0020B24DDC|nr:uncharacterized protein LOC125750962 [Brienomyrus brachyistius]
MTDPRHPYIPGRDELNARCWAGKRSVVDSSHLTEQVSVLNTHTAIVTARCPHSCLGTGWYETEKTIEMVVNFRKRPAAHTPLHINKSIVEIVSSVKFLGVHMADDLSWNLNTTTITKKARRRLHFLRKLKKASLPPPILTSFYQGTIERVLCSYITVWYGNCTTAEKKPLQWIVRTAESIIGVPLPAISHLYEKHIIRPANSIVKDTSHPSHALFSLLPSGRRFRSSRTVTARHCKSSFPQAVRALNSLPPKE